jgi:hypothetical protein
VEGWNFILGATLWCLCGALLDCRAAARLAMTGLAMTAHRPAGPKGFWFFFSKKNVFLLKDFEHEFA